MFKIRCLGIHFPQKMAAGRTSGKWVTLGMLESLLTSVAAAAHDGVPAAQSLDLVPECDPMPVSVRVLPSWSVRWSLFVTANFVCTFSGLDGDVEPARLRQPARGWWLSRWMGA